MNYIQVKKVVWVKVKVIVKVKDNGENITEIENLKDKIQEGGVSMSKHLLRQRRRDKPKSPIQ